MANRVNSARSQRNAFDTLFAQWGVRYDPTDTRIACDYAVQFRLQCTRRQGTWREIRQLDVPVILEMRDGSKTPYYLTAVTADDESVSIRTDKQESRVTVSALNEQWFGTYIALWPMPDNYAGSLRSGSREASVTELRKLLSTASKTDLGTSTVFDVNLQEELLSFQRQYGLEADGIVGAATWLMLHKAAGFEIPRLKR